MPDQPATRLPIFPLSTVLFPGSPLSLHLFEPRYLALMAEHGDDDPVFGVVLTREGREVADEPETFTVGTAASLVAKAELPDGRFAIAVVGGRRFHMGASDWSSSYMTADVEWLPETSPTAATTSLAQRAKAGFKTYVQEIARQIGDPDTETVLTEAVEAGISLDPAVCPFQIAGQLPLNTWERQRLLEIDDTDNRMQSVLEIVRRERRRLAATGLTAATPDFPGAGFSAN